MLLVTLPLIVLFSYGMVTQLVLGKPWGSRPMSDTGLAIAGPLTIGISALVLCAFYLMRMVTEVRHDGVYVNGLPFAYPMYGFKDIERVEVVDYNSLIEYGGWGIRWSPGKGWAYNVSGRGGVRIELTNRKKCLIGSQRPEDLALTIRERIGK